MSSRTMSGTIGSMLFLLALCTTAVPALASGHVGGENWTLATDNAPFFHLQGQSTVVFNNTMWVIGGWPGDYSCPGDSCNDEVWYSSNGVNWTLATAHAGFGGRYDHRSVVFDNRIWVIGGRNTTSWDPLNDVWFSTDGVNWTLATKEAPFAPRWDFGLTLLDNEMWVIGGSEDGPVHNDVWHSPDGVNWTQATDNAGFSPRMDLTATTFEGKIWVTGGFDWVSHFNDIWCSENGVNWTQVTNHAPYPARRYHTTAVADGRMWVIGGIGGENPYNWKYLTDVWYTQNGIDWTEATTDAGFPGRYDFSTTVFDNKIWVIAGTFNDIWYSELNN
jgi:leucine-zipper-like transcriptional regulator 1